MAAHVNPLRTMRTTHRPKSERAIKGINNSQLANHNELLPTHIDDMASRVQRKQRREREYFIFSFFVLFCVDDEWNWARKMGEKPPAKRTKWTFTKYICINGFNNLKIKSACARKMRIYHAAKLGRATSHEPCHPIFAWHMHSLILISTTERERTSRTQKKAFWYLAFII